MKLQDGVVTSDYLFFLRPEKIRYVLVVLERWPLETGGGPG